MKYKQIKDFMYYLYIYIYYTTHYFTVKPFIKSNSQIDRYTNNYSLGFRL